MKLALLVQLIVGHPTERPITIGDEVYTLRLTPLSCENKEGCGTPMIPRRFRGVVLKDGRMVGMFDRPCVGVCEGLEKTVERALKR